MEKNSIDFGKLTTIISDAGDKIITSLPQGQPLKLRVVRRSVFFKYEPPQDVMAIKTHK
jgi:hypothetical protein